MVLNNLSLHFCVLKASNSYRDLVWDFPLYKSLKFKMPILVHNDLYQNLFVGYLQKPTVIQKNICLRPTV